MIPYKQRQRWYKIIFEADTPAGKRFDVVLLVAILLSLFVIVLDSVAGVRAQWGYELQVLEWMFTLLFTAEYILRIVVSPRPRAYIRSTFGLIDLLSVLPNYLEFMAPNIHYLMVIRLFRMLRVFRVFKLHQFVSDADTIQFALKAIGRKMLIFFCLYFNRCCGGRHPVVCGGIPGKQRLFRHSFGHLLGCGYAHNRRIRGSCTDYANGQVHRRVGDDVGLYGPCPSRGYDFRRIH